jgi:hypothetical protein
MIVLVLKSKLDYNPESQDPNKDKDLDQMLEIVLALIRKPKKSLKQYPD